VFKLFGRTGPRKFRGPHSEKYFSASGNFFCITVHRYDAAVQCKRTKTKGTTAVLNRSPSSQDQGHHSCVEQGPTTLDAITYHHSNTFNNTSAAILLVYVCSISSFVYFFINTHVYYSCTLYILNKFITTIIISFIHYVCFVHVDLVYKIRKYFMLKNIR